MATAFKKQTGTMGKNVKFTIDEKGIMTITVNLADRHGKSASGKTDIVATTSGNAAIGDTGVVLGLNAYIKV